MFESFDGKDKPEKSREQEGMDRREFLKALGKAGAATAAAIWGLDKVDDYTEQENESLRYDGEKLSHRRKDIPTGELAGRKENQVNDLYKIFLGLSVNLDDVHNDKLEIPEVIEDVDFVEQLGALWSTKRQLNPEELTPVAHETGEQLINEYAELTPNGVSIDDYSEEIDRVTQDLHGRLDWENVQAQFNLSDRRVKLAKDICGEVSGRELLSYALTELMPSKEGDLNKDVLNYLLKNAGREFVERIPAVHDGLTSFGPYQFTAKALFQTPEGVRGASQLAEHISGEGIPGSVSKLRGIDHHQAAYLLATKNITELIQNLDSKGVEQLKDGWAYNMSDIAQFIATAHNYPYGGKNFNGAITAGEYWLANGMEQKYQASCGYKTKPYAQKTEQNYEALEDIA